jgi:MFS family permease
MSQHQDTPQMPMGMRYVYSFTVTNALSYLIVQGSPILLFFKKMNASTTVLSIVAALTPLLSMFQIPASRFVEQYGYKRFVLFGWTFRTYLILVMAAVAFLPSLDCATRIALMLFVLFIYNIMRGVSMCGFLPWMSQLVPRELRGQYISNDQMFLNITTISLSLLMALYLGYFSELHHFAGLFVFSFIAGMVSLYFIRRMPDVIVQKDEEIHQGIAWQDMLKCKPFVWLVVFGFLYNFSLSVGAVFFIPFTKDLFFISDSLIMIISSIYFLFCIFSFRIFGRILDRVGSRPFLIASSVIMVIHFIGWGCVAAHLWPFDWRVIAWQQMTAGFATSFCTMASTRLLMNVVPSKGRSQFFATYTTVNSITTALIPIGCGIFVDSFHNWIFKTKFWTWNAYSILYLVIAFVLFIAFLSMEKIQEDHAMDTREFLREIFYHTPKRCLHDLLRRPNQD